MRQILKLFGCRLPAQMLVSMWVAPKALHWRVVLLRVADQILGELTNTLVVVAIRVLLRQFPVHFQERLHHGLPVGAVFGVHQWQQ